MSKYVRESQNERVGPKWLKGFPKISARGEIIVKKEHLTLKWNAFIIVEVY